jgi:hypothetical protein
MNSSNLSPLLRLPRELRDEVFLNLFFGDIHASYVSDPKALVTIVIQNGIVKKPTPVSILRTCRQLHQEGLDAFYPRLQIYLRSNRLNFLMGLGLEACSRIRHLVIQNLDITDSVGSQMPKCEWKALTFFIAKHCTSLRTLQLDLYIAEMSSQDAIWGEYSLDSEWVQALLRIRNLEDFQIKIESSNQEYDHEQCIYYNQLYPLLRKKLTSTEPVAGTVSSSLAESSNSFPFLRLPLSIQQAIIREAVLPPSRVVHPCLSPLIVDGTSALLPLLLTCRAIQQETERIIYEEAIFSSCHNIYQKEFKSFLMNRSPRQKTLMRRIYFKDLDRWINRSFVKWRAREFPNLRDLEEGMRWHLDHPCFYVLRYDDSDAE